MTSIQCPQCNYQRKPEDIANLDSCPACGVNYKKAILTKLAKTDTVQTTAPSVESEKLNLLSIIISEIKNSCENKIWFFRVPVILFFIWILIGKCQDLQSYSIFDGINLGIHEMGHPMFSFFGRFMNIAGGTILQCAAPIGAALVLLKRTDFFGVTFCMAWLATNFMGIGVYMADATDLELNLVTIGGGGDAPIPKEDMHDWHNLFNMLGLLMYDKPIGKFVSGAGIFLLIVSILASSLIVYWMWELNKNKKIL